MPIIPIIRSTKIEKVESDFSTCTITIAGTEGDSITGYCPVAFDEGSFAACEGKIDNRVGDTLTAILYKGEGYLYASGIDTVTGDAEIVESGVVKYTGDCTITLFHAA